MSFMRLLDSLEGESIESNSGPGWKHRQSSKTWFKVRICSYHERNGMTVNRTQIGLEWQDFDIELSKKNSSGLLDSIDFPCAQVSKLVEGVLSYRSKMGYSDL